MPVVMGTTGSEVFACGTLGTSAGLTSTAGLVLTATPVFVEQQKSTHTLAALATLQNSQQASKPVLVHWSHILKAGIHGAIGRSL